MPLPAPLSSTPIGINIYTQARVSHGLPEAQPILPTLFRLSQHSQRPFTEKFCLKRVPYTRSLLNSLFRSNSKLCVSVEASLSDISSLFQKYSKRPKTTPMLLNDFSRLWKRVLNPGVRLGPLMVGYLYGASIEQYEISSIVIVACSTGWRSRCIGARAWKLPYSSHG